MQTVSHEHQEGLTKARRSRIIDNLIITIIAAMLGVLAVPAASHAAVWSTYQNGPLAGDTAKMSPLYSNMKGAKGWAITAREYEIRNIETSLVLINVGRASNSEVVDFSHRAQDGYSICRWGLPQDKNTTVGTTCRVAR